MDLGQIVGNCSAGGFLYSGGTYTNIDDPLGSTVVTGINDLGQIVGYYTVQAQDGSGGTDHGFLYSGGIYTTINDPLGTAGTVVTSINDVGQIAGYYYDSNFVRHGFVGTATNGGTLDFAGASITNTNASVVVDTGSTLDLNNSTITGGTLTISGTVDSTGTSSLTGVALTNSETLETTGGSLTISGSVANNGNLQSNGSTLDITGPVTGNGTATISGSNSVLEFGSASAENTTFAPGSTGILKLDNAPSFAGTVAGLASSDGIDLANFLFSNNPTVINVTGTGNAGSTTNVTVKDGSLAATLELFNQFANQFAIDAAAYSLSADNNAPNHGTLFQLAAAH